MFADMIAIGLLQTVHLAPAEVRTELAGERGRLAGGPLDGRLRRQVTRASLVGNKRRGPALAGLPIGSQYPKGMSAESVYRLLEPLLPLVRKPVQYVGGELNSVIKDWDAADVRWALMYPDAYEVGLPNQGVQILYEVLNEQDGVLAERTYSVWPDLEALMREHRVPQFTVDVAPPGRRVRRASASASPPNSATPTC